MKLRIQLEAFETLQHITGADIFFFILQPAGQAIITFCLLLQFCASLF